MALAIDTVPVVSPADDVLGPPQGRWTYADYAAIPDDGQRYEIVEGVLYMAPAPETGHQAANIRFASYLLTHIELAGLGRVFSAPYDVELGPTTVVQPDVVVVLKHNEEIITPRRIVGAPDLAIEIASPSTAGHDRRKKQDAYERAGVTEYWIADPATRTIELQRLDEGGYRLIGVFQGKSILPSEVVGKLPVRVEQFFA